MEANNRFSKFIPERLVEAREARGLTAAELAKDVGISQQAISKFEKRDSSSPSFETIEKISSVLNVPVHFFYKDIIPFEESVVFYRSKSAATVKSKKIHANKLKWIREVSLYADALLVFPKINVPRFVTRESFIPTDFEEIEEMANKVREQWGLGRGPISNIVLLLEKMGAVVARSPFSTHSIDACSMWKPLDRPYILLSNDKTASRSRFDIAHELGHLVLHSYLKVSEFNIKENYKRIEKEANRFASAFLLPSTSFGREIFTSSLDHLISLKERWKVSINAIAYRAVQLEIFNEYQYIYIKNNLAKKDWLIKEPLDEKIPFEEPLLLKQAFEAIINNNIKTRQDVLNEIRLHHEEIEAIANLENNYLVPKEPGKVFTFKIK